jgi:predicted lipid-binding transport protein (Tim44 family)
MASTLDNDASRSGMFTSRSRLFLSLAALAALIEMLGAALIVPDAHAQRLGGGKSFERQSSNATREQAQPPAREALPAQPSQDAPAANGQFGPSGRQLAPSDRGRGPIGRRFDPSGRRLGPIGGLAVALGITALLADLGLVGPLAELLAGALTIGLPALAALLVWRMLRGPRAPRQAVRRLEPAFNVAQIIGTPPSRARGGVADARPSSVTAADPSRVTGVAGARPGARAVPPVPIAPHPAGVPPDFDIQAFVRTAKVQFLRVQAAWEAGNLADIGRFTTPEILAEIRGQLDEDPDAGSRTQMVRVEADLLAIEEGPEDWVARVRFSGTIRQPGESAQPFQEIWSLAKRKKRGAGWLLAGIQHLP